MSNTQGSNSSRLAETKTPAIQAAIFDLDGVLIDSERLAFQVWKEIVEQYGGRLDEGAFPNMVGMTAEETARYCMEYAGITFDLEEGCAQAWRGVIERLGRQIDPLPGATALVRELAERGIPLAIASNSPAHYIENALHGLGLLPFFPVRVGVDQVSEGKPAPEVYVTAARRLGATPERCLAVEDSRVGMQAALAAGMRVLAVPSAHDRSDGFERAWRVFASLESVRTELESVLE